ncbi:MAG: hypothetical protein J3K34DRAFT_264074 [Monoraphidium minutum]|nr:MAG: hypothetical protein J3K34DRAFT_264074 [Monoraphidium minutum]
MMQPLAARAPSQRGTSLSRAPRQAAAVCLRPKRIRRLVGCPATNEEGCSAVPDSLPIVPLGGDTFILRSFVRPADHAAPRFDLDLDGALRVQLEALQSNNKPYNDHGIEVMYRFAAFDPFERSRYFGRSFDLGQFERFRRVFHTPAYRCLLNHDTCDVISKFKMGESKYAVRVLARHEAPIPEDSTYTITLFQVRRQDP